MRTRKEVLLHHTSVCFDLAHAYVAGYDLATLAGFQQLCAEIEGTLGFPRLQLIHLNNAYESCLGVSIEDP